MTPLTQPRPRVQFVVSEALMRDSTVRDVLQQASRAFGNVLPLVVSPDEALEKVQGQLARTLASTQAPQVVCLIGDDDAIPFARVPDPTGRGGEVLTDNFYGRTTVPNEAERLSGDLLPDLPVTRLPTRDPALLRALLDPTVSLSATWDNGLAVSTDVWAGASHAVCEELRVGAALVLSPPARADDLRPLFDFRPGRVYFNVHGSDQTANWIGDDGDGDHPVVLRPTDPRVADGAIVVSEACFGAYLFEDETPLSLAFLRAGARSFVGSTIIAWGPPEAPPALADLMVTGYYGALDRGIDASTALLEAKRALLASDEMSPQLHNTALSFVHYGAPAATTGRSAGPLPTGSSVSGGVSVLDAARRRVQQRVSANDWAVLSSGREAWTSLSQSLGNSAEAHRALHELQADLTTPCTVSRYRVAGRDRLSISSRRRGTSSWVAVVTDADGKVLRRCVTRSG